ncbi:hypothetical protein Hanom_Chr10g00922671 [Helianthus anomalus]
MSPSTNNSESGIWKVFELASTRSQGLIVEEINSVFCTLECRGRVEAYRLHNSELIQDYNDIKGHNSYLTKNERLFKEKSEAQRKDIIQLKDDLSVKTCHYLGLKKSKLVKDLCDLQLVYKKRKGCGLGYSQVPPLYNHNYTYLPFIVEELVNEDTKTYDLKTDKSSINNKPFEKRATHPIMFVSKGVIDANASSSRADEVIEVTGEDSLFGSLSSFGPDVLGKTVNACDEHLDTMHDDGCFSVVNDCDSSNVTATDSVTGEVPHDAFSEKIETPFQEYNKCADFSSESVSIEVPNVESSENTLNTEASSESPSNTPSSCDEEIFESCETKLEPDFEKEMVVTSEIKSHNDFSES